MPARALPPRPNLEQYKKQAKDLVADRANATPEAFERIRHFHPRFRALPDSNIQRAAFKLSDAQLIIAREHAFESWPKFASHVRTFQPDESARPVQVVQQIPVDGIELSAEITVPEDSTGLVLFTNASGSGRYHPRNRSAADLFQSGALGTVQIDLLTEEEELADMASEDLRFDLRLLGRRIAAITAWIGGHPMLKRLGLGYFGSGTGAAAALLAAAEHPRLVRAVVSSGGRPDLAGPWLARVHAPTLLIVGSKDTVALGFSHSVMAPVPQQADRKLAIIDGAGQLFDEPDAWSKGASLACDWFRKYLVTL